MLLSTYIGVTAYPRPLALASPERSPPRAPTGPRQTNQNYRPSAPNGPSGNRTEPKVDRPMAPAPEEVAHLNGQTVALLNQGTLQMKPESSGEDASQGSARISFITGQNKDFRFKRHMLSSPSAASEKPAPAAPSQSEHLPSRPPADQGWASRPPKNDDVKQEKDKRAALAAKAKEAEEALKKIREEQERLDREEADSKAKAEQSRRETERREDQSRQRRDEGLDRNDRSYRPRVSYSLALMF